MTPEEAQLLALEEIRNGGPQWEVRFERVKEVYQNTDPEEPGLVVVIDRAYKGTSDLHRNYCLVDEDRNVSCILDVEEMPADVRKLLKDARRAKFMPARELRAARLKG